MLPDEVELIKEAIHLDCAAGVIKTGTLSSPGVKFHSPMSKSAAEEFENH